MTQRMPPSPPQWLVFALLSLPEPLWRRFTGKRRPRLDGQTLDPQVELILWLAEHNRLPGLETMSPEQARSYFARSRLFDCKPRPMERIENLTAPGPGGALPLRIYVPRGIRSPAPALVWFHGGGWVVGNLDTHDASLRLLADEARSIIVSVDYRLAPEHRFPAAADDALAAWRWALENASAHGIDASRLAIGGDSAGGNLAAVTSQRARDERLTLPKLQTLVYPVTDLRCETASYRTFESGYFLTAATMHWFIDHYLGADRELALDPRASPLMARDFRGLPPTYVWSAGYDVLRDEARQYADALDRAGVAVRYTCYEGLLHSFLAMTGGIRSARRAALEVAHRIREELT